VRRDIVFRRQGMRLADDFLKTRNQIGMKSFLGLFHGHRDYAG